MQIAGLQAEARLIKNDPPILLTGEHLLLSWAALEENEID